MIYSCTSTPQPPATTTTHIEHFTRLDGERIQILHVTTSKEIWKKRDSFLPELYFREFFRTIEQEQ